MTEKLGVQRGWSLLVREKKEGRMQASCVRASEPVNSLPYGEGLCGCDRCYGLERSLDPGRLYLIT